MDPEEEINDANANDLITVVRWQASYAKDMWGIANALSFDYNSRLLDDTLEEFRVEPYIKAINRCINRYSKYAEESVNEQN
jgi:hypothetical protein